MPPKCTVMLGLALACHIPASHAERADRDLPMHLEANQVSMDDARQISTFTGKVQLAQGTLTIQADKLVVIQDQDGNKFGTATGQPASFRQKREGSDEFVEGFGERITYSTRIETIDLYGQARMKRGHDEVRGEHITYNSRTEIFQAHSLPQEAGSNSEGRVRVIIQPKKDTAPVVPGNESRPLELSPALQQPKGKP